MGSAIIGMHSNLAPAIYERLGDPAAAARRAVKRL